MLSKEDNDLLTQTGPDTPCGYHDTNVRNPT